MQNIKSVQAQLEIIIDENGLNSAIAALCNAIDSQIRGKATEYAEERSEAFYGSYDYDQLECAYSYEDTEEYKNLSLALGVLEAVMQSFDIDDAKATWDTRAQLMTALIENLTRLTVTR